MKTNFVKGNVTPLWLAFGPCRIRSIQGQNPSGDLFLQLFEAPSGQNSPIQAGTLPRESLYIQGDNGFKYEWVNGNDFQKDLSIAVSTTQDMYTAPAANGGANFDIDYDGPNLVNDPRYTIIDSGDYTTLAYYFQAWTEAAGTPSASVPGYKLRRLDVGVQSIAGNSNAGAGLTEYLMGYACDLANFASNTGRPGSFAKLQFSIKMTSNMVGQDKQFSFGSDGTQFLEKWGDGTTKGGLLLTISSSGHNESPVAQTDFKFRAIYSSL